LLLKAENISNKIDQYLESWHKKFEIVGKVHGIGSMRAFELIDERTKEPTKDKAKELIKICYEKGLAILTCGKFGNIIRMLMPLVITEEQLETGLKMIEEGLQVLTIKSD